MASDLTIPARLVAEGVGLPPVWLEPLSGSWYVDFDPDCIDDERLDLTDPQTAFGVALRLDAWERAGGGMPSWAQQYAQIAHRKPDALLDQVGDYLRGLAARVRHIGMDHAIRRALGWSVEPGTLATLERGLSLRSARLVDRPAQRSRWWQLSHAGRVQRLSYDRVGDHGWIPALAGITDPTEALAAIYAEVCGG